MLIHHEQLEGTCAVGTFSINTSNLRGLCHHIGVKPATESTIYSIKITNDIGMVIYDRTSETGTLSEFIDLPVYGIYTVTVYDSTANEAFVILLGIEE